MEGGVGMRWVAAIITTSHNGSRNEIEETSVQVVRELVEEELDGEIVDERMVPGEVDELMAALIEITDYYRPDLIVTIGGIGIGAYDVTPDATLQVIDRELPGIAEAMRRHAMQRSPQAMFTRAVCGIRNRTLILNLPEAPAGVHESLSVIIDQLPYAFRELREV